MISVSCLAERLTKWFIPFGAPPGVDFGIGQVIVAPKPSPQTQAFAEDTLPEKRVERSLAVSRRLVTIVLPPIERELHPSHYHSIRQLGKAVVAAHQPRH